MQDERDALGRGHRIEHDEEGHVDRLVEGDPVRRVDRGAARPLASDATATGDGGGLVRAALRPVEGAEQIARFFADRASAAPDVTILECTVNGQPGLVAQLVEVGLGAGVVPLPLAGAVAGRWLRNGIPGT